MIVKILKMWYYIYEFYILQQEEYMSLFSKVLLAGVVVVAAKGLDNRLEVSHYVVKNDKLPDDFDDFRIVQLSDFHCDKTAGLFDAIKNEHPDIICVTGDMAHDTGSYLPFIDLLKDLVNVAPVYIVSGNHDIWRNDYDELIEECKKYGAFVLQNEGNYINKNDKSILICGIEDPSTISYGSILEKISQSLEKLPNSDEFSILLFHRANLLDLFKDTDFDLILAGHMHGGQFRIPGIGGVISPKTNIMAKGRLFFPKYFGGEYTLEDKKIIVSRGVGNKTFLPRFYNRPEICTIILKKSIS